MGMGREHSSDELALSTELKGWNWGAFGLTWIWGIVHRTPIAFLVFLPVLGWFGMPVLLGLKGNQWAWKNREWRDLAAFRRSQRTWAKAALVAWLGSIATALIAWKFAITALTNSDAFLLAQAELQADPQVVEALGAPIAFGTPSGSVAVGGGASGTAELKFSVSGPKAQGEAFVAARQSLGTWRIDNAAIELANGARIFHAPQVPSRALPALPAQP